MRTASASSATAAARASLTTPPVAVPLQMGTLSKAVGGYGGYLCTSRSVAELVRNRARSFVYSTGLPPGIVAAASRALDLIAADKELVRRPLDARARVHGGARPACRRRARSSRCVMGSAARGARGERRAARRGLPRRRDPAADGAAGHVAAARDVLGRAHGRAGRGARRRRAAVARAHDDGLRHVVGHGHRQDVRDAAADRGAHGRGPRACVR